MAPWALAGASPSPAPVGEGVGTAFHGIIISIILIARCDWWVRVSAIFCMIFMEERKLFFLSYMNFI